MLRLILISGLLMTTLALPIARADDHCGKIPSFRLPSYRIQLIGPDQKPIIKPLNAVGAFVTSSDSATGNGKTRSDFTGIPVGFDAATGIYTTEGRDQSVGNAYGGLEKPLCRKRPARVFFRFNAGNSTNGRDPDLSTEELTITLPEAAKEVAELAAKLPDATKLVEIKLTAAAAYEGDMWAVQDATTKTWGFKFVAASGAQVEPFEAAPAYAKTGIALLEGYDLTAAEQAAWKGLTAEHTRVRLRGVVTDASGTMPRLKVHSLEVLGGAQPVQVARFDCVSTKKKKKSCGADFAITDATVESWSTPECDRGKNWDIVDGRIEAKDGCQGSFRVVGAAR